MPTAYNPHRFHYTALPATFLWNSKLWVHGRRFLSPSSPDGGMGTVDFCRDKAVRENMETGRTGALSMFPKWGVRHTHASSKTKRKSE